MDDDIPYLLLTPGPLTTSRTVREAMRSDYSTWDVDYNQIVSRLRADLVNLATIDSGVEPTGSPEKYTSVLMQGSGTFSVEATLGSVIPPEGKLLVINNGAYGARIAQIAHRLKIDCLEIKQPETTSPDLGQLKKVIQQETGLTHVAMVHCETTTGMLNPVEAIGQLVHQAGLTYIVDAMSSFGGIPMSMESLNADFLISSANKCVQGVPGFGFVIADREKLIAAEGWARSLSLDLFDQWREMEQNGGKWRYTSPTHTVLGFSQAMQELQEEGGVTARYARYVENHRRLVAGMEKIGYQTLLQPEHQSPIITSFLYPEHPQFDFRKFYDLMKSRRFVLYPGKVTDAETFRIGNIGHIFPEDIDLLTRTIAAVSAEMGVEF